MWIVSMQCLSVWLSWFLSNLCCYIHFLKSWSKSLSACLKSFFWTSCFSFSSCIYQIMSYIFIVQLLRLALILLFLIFIWFVIPVFMSVQRYYKIVLFFAKYCSDRKLCLIEYYINIYFAQVISCISSTVVQWLIFIS